MKFVIAGGNLKIFGKSIHCLSKIGDEIYFEPSDEAISLKTINSSRSTFVSYSLKKKFFTHFDGDFKSKLNDTLMDDSRFGDDPIQRDLSSETFKCKIPSKCFLSIFKNMNNIEKNVEKCTITVKHVLLNESSQTRIYDYDATMMKKVMNDKNEEEIYEIKFLIIMSCKFGMKKTYILSISECENLEAVFNRASCPNHLTISAKYLNETMNSFSNDIEEITFLVESNKLTVKNYSEVENEKSKTTVNTQVIFDQDEFQNYDIEKETHITFCLKEFKVCLLFGFFFDLPLDINYERKGRPIVFNYLYNEYFDVNFTLATLNDDLSIQSNSQISNLSTQQSILLPNNSLLNDKRPTNTKAKNATIVRFEETKSQKSNKRTLHDSSNSQTYLNESASDLSPTRTESNQNGTSQILSNKSSRTLDNGDEIHAPIDDQLPPSKKLKSLMQSLFDHSMDLDTPSDENHDATKKLSNNTSVYVENTDSEDDD